VSPPLIDDREAAASVLSSNPQVAGWLPKLRAMRPASVDPKHSDRRALIGRRVARRISREASPDMTAPRQRLTDCERDVIATEPA
jgi:hypothetical protein